jgi:hypothetical protein
LALSACCFAGVAAAHGRYTPVVPWQAGQPAPHVDDLVAIALGRSSEVDMMRARLNAAREMVSPAGALPNPTSSLTYTEADFPHFSVGREPMSAVTIEYRQGLPAAEARGSPRRGPRGRETKARGSRPAAPARARCGPSTPHIYPWTRAGGAQAARELLRC